MDEFDTILKQFEKEDDKKAEETARPNILVVDDDQSIREGLKTFLAHKYDVRTAESGKQGIELMNSTFHCVVLDVKMQGMDGFETYPKLKERCPDVPIVFFTAFQSEHDLQEIINRFKPEGYVEKGQDIAFLEHLVDRAADKYQLILKNEAYKKQLAEKVEKLNAAYGKLEQQAEKLNRLNVTLNVLLEKGDQKLTALEKSIQKNIEKSILTDIDKLKTDRLTAKQKELIAMIESNLQEITSNFLLNISIADLGLTPSELKIANYIKQGKTSKEIATYLNISTNTVKNHRLKIRKKLKITGKGVNLYSRLSSP